MRETIDVMKAAGCSTAIRLWLVAVLVVSTLAALEGLEEFGPESVGAQPWSQSGISLEFGMAVSGELDDTTFRQIYMFTALANEVIALSMTRTEGDLDPYLLLVDGQGAILSLSDDDGSGSDASIASKRIPVDGRFFVVATRYGQEHGSTTGAYSLLLSRVGAGITETATTVQYGDSVLGQITDADPTTFYFLRAWRGDVIHITMQRTSGNLDPHLDLATVNGQILVSNDDDPDAEGTLDAGIAQHTILETGLYLVVATRFGREAGDTEGSYMLSAEQVPPENLGAYPEQARLIDYGMTLEGTIDDEIPLRYYQFSGQRGDVITVTLSARSGNLDPLLVLADSNLVSITQDDNSGDDRNARIAAFTLSASGTYYLVTTRAGEAAGQTTGSYSLSLTGRAGIVGGQALEIVYGAAVSGRIENQNSAEEYVFFGQQGDVIRISMVCASGDLDALITLYDSERKQIIFDDDGGQDKNALIERFELPRDDLYILVASRFEREIGTTSGAYILTLELVRSGR